MEAKPGEPPGSSVLIRTILLLRPVGVPARGQPIVSLDQPAFELRPFVQPGPRLHRLGKNEQRLSAADLVSVTLTGVRLGILTMSLRYPGVITSPA